MEGNGERENLRRGSHSILTYPVESYVLNATVRSADEDTGLTAYSGWKVCRRLLTPSPLARVQSFADSLTSVSLHAHIYKNTVKR
jgi:hypothetical protein